MCEEVDFFRDTWVRYLGYANEVGESFRAVAPVKLVRLSYKIAFTYVFADTIHKSLKSIRTAGSSRRVALEAGDALIWQTLASVVIPGITINRICAFSHKPLAKLLPKLRPNRRAMITVAIGLLSIPIIIHPIDAGTTLLMDLTYRQFVKKQDP